ncbi:hypothetical protein BJ170DRAFT_704721 [Xylariales sp. AK1849]|nr:hypothetical protein BJ170DRAFT_704721 [Xylariales sp. AK1849]
MARPQNRKRQRVDDPPQDQVPPKKAKPSILSSRPSTIQNRKRRVNDTPYNQAPSKKAKPSGVSLRPSRSQNRKKRADDPPQEQASSKRPESIDTLHRPSNFPPEFYDNLSKVWLTRRALQEHDRRNENILPSKPVAGLVRSRGTKLAAFARLGVPDRVVFVSSGGPDLSDFQGYPEPTNITRTMASTSSSVTSKPVSVGSRRTYLTKAITVSFKNKNATRSEGTVMRNVVPLIAGDADIPNEGHLPFTNLASITKNITVNLVPDFFDGAYPEAMDKRVREDLDNIIIPTKKGGVSIAPHFFLEAKGPGGTIEVANYLLDEPVYDGNAYTFTSILLNGYLKLYVHHLTTPTKSGQRPGYHTTPLKAYTLSDDEVYPDGRGAFRNLRMRAKEDRDWFIEIANARARDRSKDDADTEGDLASTTEEQQDVVSSPLDFFGCRMFAEPDDDQETQETNVGLAILHHTYGEDDANHAEVSVGFATSFTSSFTSVGSEDHLRRPKMPRSPPSPSSLRHFKKRGPA